MAQIGAAHGLKGEVRLCSFTGDPHAFAQYGPLETEDGARSFEIESLRPPRTISSSRFRGVADRDAAEALRNVDLYVEREQLPRHRTTTNSTIADLIGLQRCRALPARRSAR